MNTLMHDSMVCLHHVRRRKQWEEHIGDCKGRGDMKRREGGER